MRADTDTLTDCWWWLVPAADTRPSRRRRSTRSRSSFWVRQRCLGMFKACLRCCCCLRGYLCRCAVHLFLCGHACGCAGGYKKYKMPLLLLVAAVAVGMVMRRSSML